MEVEYPCIFCSELVRPRQHGIECDSCEKWQHRTCETGISQKQYLEANRGEKEIKFVCKHCENSSIALNNGTQEYDNDAISFLEEAADGRATDDMETEDTPLNEQAIIVYGMSIRTNNDVEGWYKRLNNRAGTAPPLYMLIRLLADESRVAVRNVQLVTELQLTRHQRSQQTSMQGQISRLWKLYRRGYISATGLLKELSTKYKPSV